MYPIVIKNTKTKTKNMSLGLSSNAVLNKSERREPDQYSFYNFINFPPFV